MPANIDPIYIAVPDIQTPNQGLLGANALTLTDGTGSNIYSIYTSSNTNGSYVYKVVLKSSNSVAATVARLWYCSDTGATFTPGTTNNSNNTSMLAELTLAAFTASATAASPQYEIPVNMPLQANTKLLLSFGTSTGTGSNQFTVVTVAGKY